MEIEIGRYVRYFVSLFRSSVITKVEYGTYKYGEIDPRLVIRESRQTLKILDLIPITPTLVGYPYSLLEKVQG